MCQLLYVVSRVKIYLGAWESWGNCKYELGHPHYHFKSSSAWEQPEAVPADKWLFSGGFNPGAPKKKDVDHTTEYTYT